MPKTVALVTTAILQLTIALGVEHTETHSAVSDSGAPAVVDGGSEWG